MVDRPVYYWLKPENKEEGEKQSQRWTMTQKQKEPKATKDYGVIAGREVVPCV